jgi:hypothetical protein
MWQCRDTTAYNSFDSGLKISFPGREGKTAKTPILGLIPYYGRGSKLNRLKRISGPPNSRQR